jgi:hypothetical protein
MIANSKNSCLFLLLLIILLSGCAPTRVVRTLPKGQAAVSAGIGGPLISYKSTMIPMPLTSVSGAYGITEGLSGFAGIHTTSLAFGLFQADLGVTQKLLESKGYRPGLTISPVANLMLDKWQYHFKFYPEADINVYWEYGKRRSYCYLGMFNWFELAAKRAFGQDQPYHWLQGFSIGNTFCGSKWSFTVEGKYIAPFYSNRDLVVTYGSLGSTGAIGIYFGTTRKFSL